MKDDEAGSALIESVLLGLLFLVPTLWAVVLLADVHRGALATTAAAREAGFEAVRWDDRASAARAVDGAVEMALENHGLDPTRARVVLTASGLARGSAVEVGISYPVRLFRLPLIGGDIGPSLWIRARHVARIDPYRSES
jgi:hypothetical protein